MGYFKNIILTTLSATAILVSCNHGATKGTALSAADKDYIKGLGLLDDNEAIVLFDRQSDIKTSGNFFTDRRIASYWIDKRDKTNSSSNFAFYNDIDTILTKDLSRSLTYASYLEIVKHDGKKFKVYVDGDSIKVRSFFDSAISAWRIKSNR